MDPQNQTVATPPVIPQMPQVTVVTQPPQPITSQQIQPATVKYAGFGRLAALIIDGIISSILALPIAILLAYNFAHDDPTNLISIIWGLVSITYYIFFGTRFGATPGKMLLKMKIVDHNYVKPSMGRIMLRETVGKWVSGMIFLISVLFVIFDKQKRSLHDLIASTYVIYK